MVAPDKAVNQTRVFEILAWVFILIGFLAGIVAVISTIVLLLPGQDEISTFIETKDNNLWHLWSLLRQGLDTPYTSTALIWLTTKTFGSSLIMQRLLSFGFWAIAILVFYKVVVVAGGHRLLAALCACGLALGELQRFAAQSGRFYGLLFLLAMLLLYVLMKSIRQERFPNFLGLASLILLGFLTSEVFGLLIIVIVGAFTGLVVFKRQRQWFLLLFYFILTAVISMLIYMALANLQNQFLQYRFIDPTVEVDSSDVMMGATVDLGVFLTNIARWSAWPNVPGVPGWIEISATFALFFAALILRWKRPNLVQERGSSEGLKATWIWLVLLGICAVGLLLILSLIQPILNARWAARYFVPISMGVMAIMAGSFAPFKIRNFEMALLMILAAGMCADSVSYLRGIKPMAEKRAALEQIALGIFEPDQATLSEEGKIILLFSSVRYRLYGHLYILHPEYRDRLVLAFSDWYIERPNNYKTILADNFKASNLRFESEIPAEVWRSSRVIVSKDDLQSKGINNYEVLSYVFHGTDKDSAIVSGSDWLQSVP